GAALPRRLSVARRLAGSLAARRRVLPAAVPPLGAAAPNAADDAIGAARGRARRRRRDVGLSLLRERDPPREPREVQGRARRGPRRRGGGQRRRPAAGGLGRVSIHGQYPVLVIVLVLVAVLDPSGRDKRCSRPGDEDDHEDGGISLV